jgi:hypothetical protein
MLYMKVAAVNYGVVLCDFRGWYPSTHQIILIMPRFSKSFLVICLFVYFDYMTRLLRVETIASDEGKPDECETICGMKIGKENRSTWRNPRHSDTLPTTNPMRP